MSENRIQNNKGKFRMPKLGWLPDIPDDRDYVYEAPLKLIKCLPIKVDLRRKCPPIYNQGNLGSCTANALIAAIEYSKKFNKKKTLRLSRLFLYYNERVMLGTIYSDSGAYLRDGVKSLNKQGVCPEKEWPYRANSKPGSKFTQKPPQKCYDLALDHQILSYWRIPIVLDEMRACLAEGYPFVFGFSVYSSFMSEEVRNTGIMPIPEKGEQMLGGHAVMAVGYDDEKKMLLVRNSWGKEWGDNGHFWMPYAYLKSKNCADFWTIRDVE